MLKKRIIPVVLFRNGYVVQSKLFKTYKNLGNPVVTINRLSEWGADEICFWISQKMTNGMLAEVI